jgi:polyisoprenoid-binding protein YceI
MRFVTISALGLLLIACGGNEGPPADAIADTPDIVPNYRIIPDGSQIVVSAEQQGEFFTGRFAEFDAVIKFDADDLAGSQVMVRIPLSGLDLGSADRNDAIPSKTWFNMGRHPIATFESDQITQTATGYQAQGSLTMKGLRRPVTLPFTLEDRVGQTVMRGQVDIDRTVWNLGESPWDTEEYVSHTVSIDVTVVAERM